MTNQVSSGLENLVERAIFNHRPILVVLFLLLTVFLGYRATFVRPDTNLEKMVPQEHSFIQNAHQLLARADSSNSKKDVDIRVAVAVEKGDIFSPEYMETLKKISDEVSLLPGVDTGALLSLWTPALRWDAVTTEGFDGGPIIDSSKYDGSAASLEQIRNNLLKSSYIGSYVANDFMASLVTLPVIKIDPRTKEALDFQDFSHALETIRDKYQSENLRIHIIGDVKKFADLTDGFSSVGIFFAIAFLITAILLYFYSRCWKSTATTLACSVVAVVWQLGLLNLLGYGIGVFSVLVPFLVFAIGISHGVQIINAIAHEAAKGENRFDSARVTFRYLVKPGLLALLSDGIGFATLLIINIGVIQDLAIAASIGVAIIILTNLVLLPVLMSYFGVTRSCVEHAQYKKNGKSSMFEWVANFSELKCARIAILIAVLVAGIGVYYGQGLKIGDLDRGAPELRPDSRYNLDNDYITSHFSTSTDQMVVFVDTAPDQASSYKTADLLNRFEWVLQNTPGVQSVSSAASWAKFLRLANNEGNLKFLALPRRVRTLSAYTYGTELDTANSLTALKLELADHKEETLQQVVAVVEQFALTNNDPDITFSLGYGNGAYEAATNQVITTAQYLMMLCVYAVVSLMCLLTFRSWRAAVCVILPLMLTSVLCQALMALLGIGVKVGTLPVIALGVGIGVDYGIYIFSRLESYLRLGHTLRTAYLETLLTTGKAVCFTGLTLAIGVGTWIFSPIKFQADMGILLTFMFLWNMVGALLLLPALARFLIKPEKYVEQATETGAVPEQDPGMTLKYEAAAD